MADGYIQTSLVECNRQSSEQAKSNNNENTSSWTNNLNNVIQLEANDKVSVYSSFVSEKGAGSSNTIEIKGISMRKTKSFTYIKDITAETIRKQNIDNATSLPENGYLTNGIEGAFGTNEIVEYHEEITEDIELRDDEVNIIIDYNKTADGNGYFQVPRNYIARRPTKPLETEIGLYTQSFPNTGQATGVKESGSGVPPSFPWSFPDTDVTGRPNYTSNIVPAQFLRSDYIPDSKNLRMIQDNKKFTIFIRKNIKFKQNESPPITLQVNGESRYLSVAPEGFDYIWYREKKTLKVDSGFLSAQYVANDLSRQLQAITKEYNIVDVDNFVADTSKFRKTKRSVISETETYKTFFTNNINYSKTLYDDATEILAPGTFTGKVLLYPLSTRWYENYNTIGIKRPELWNTGNKLAINGVYSIADDGTITWPSLTPYPATNPQQTTDRLRGTTLTRDYLYTDIINNDQDTLPMEINIPYTPANLLLLKNFINAQELYPEIFEEWTKNESANTVSYYSSDNNIENTRWFHMNNKNSQIWTTVDTADPPVRHIYNDVIANWNSDNFLMNFTAVDDEQAMEQYKLNFERTYLGWGHWKPNYGDSKASTLQSLILLIHYNSKYRDTFFDNPDKVGKRLDDSDLKLTYGCFTRTDNNLIGVFIQNRSKKLDVPPILLNTNTETTSRIEYGRKFGFDEHWNAFGTVAIGLESGYGIGVHYYQNDFSKEETEATIININNKPETYMIKRYIGAVEPTIGFDGDHFYISNLHTDMKIGNKLTNGANIAGLSFTAGLLNDKKGVALESAADSPNDICYRINPQENLIEFCIERCPYQYPEVQYTANGAITAEPVAGTTAGDAPFYRYKFNNLLQAWTIYDSPTGIGIYDMGITEDLWDRSLWGTLGFSYKQFNSSINNRLLRMNTSNQNSISYITTNSIVSAKDTSSYVVNDNSIPLISERLPFNSLNYLYSRVGVVLEPDDGGIDLKPEIIQKTSSIQIVADNFPINMRDGYYTIRSDIVPDSFFVGGKTDNTNMPIVSIVNKQSPESDYFFTTDEDIVFTVTRPTLLSSINVSICDPDGTFANTSGDSSVIFKIQRPIKTSFNIVEQILSEEKSKK